jgi:hypothetical protein
MAAAGFATSMEGVAVWMTEDPLSMCVFIQQAMMALPCPRPH